MGLFSFLKKKKQDDEVTTTVDLINFVELADANDSNLTKVATDIINGNPLVVNLEQLDIDEANKVIAFLSGVIYAIEGHIVNIEEKIIMFGNSEVYLDGSMKDFLDDLTE